MAELRMKIACECCGSENVTRDGILRWSVEDQRWECASELDNTDCDDCGAENCAKEVPA